MTKVYFHYDGTPSRNPTSYEEAKRHRKLRYDDRILCNLCNECSIKYTSTHACIHCARLEAMRFYNAATAAEHVDPGTLSDHARAAADALIADLGDYDVASVTPNDALTRGHAYWVRVEPCSKHGHVGLRTPNGDCWGCLQARNARSARQRARAAGEDTYAPDEPCKVCGAMAPRRVDNSRCVQCYPPRPVWSPRQQALAAGERWYAPDTPCKRCGTTAPRRVDNGQCRGCTTPATPTEQAQRNDMISSIVESTPDLVMSRADARAAGMPVYRTGKACKHGHTAHRYVSTGACMQCVANQRRGGA